MPSGPMFTIRVYGILIHKGCVLVSDDLIKGRRFTPDTRVIAVDIPKTHAANALPWGSYRTSVDAMVQRCAGSLRSVLQRRVG